MEGRIEPPSRQDAKMDEPSEADDWIARQIQLPIQYGDTIIDGGLRLDRMVNESVVVAIKAVENILPLHKARLLT